MTYGQLAPTRYPPLSKLLHWLIALAVLVTIPVALVMVRVGEGPLQDSLYNLHKALGIVILVLMLLRLVNRLLVGAPAPEPGIARWQQALSSAVHGTLYVLLLAMAVVGYVANSAFGASVPFFGLFDIPPMMEKNEPLADTLFALHRWAGFLVALLVILHIGAALFHHVILRDGVLRRMLPLAFGGR